MKGFKETFKELCIRYKHGLCFLYALIYFPWFSIIEKHVTWHFHIVHMPLDDMIPFNEFFIIPYLFWFPYVAIPLVYFFLTDKETFLKSCKFLFTGMTLFLIISTIYPNGAYLRPIVFKRDNILTELVKILYKMDTPTNLFPSIHVYNALGTHLSICYSAKFKGSRAFKTGSLIIAVFIVLSTMFIKQHSVFDVITAVVMVCIFWIMFYVKDFSLIRRIKAKRIKA
ncbi:MAG: phosphatase PAP2 family protein [Lachnospiraceae bacterium]|nr:phosphatase PAP2 family protein [Lachnospiraceae bacterium]